MIKINIHISTKKKSVYILECKSKSNKRLNFNESFDKTLNIYLEIGYEIFMISIKSLAALNATFKLPKTNEQNVQNDDQ